MLTMARVDCSKGQSDPRGKSELLMKSVKQQHEMAGKLLIKTLELKHGAHVRGIQKLERKIKAEKGFLESVQNNKLKITHL